MVTSLSSSELELLFGFLREFGAELIERQDGRDIGSLGGGRLVFRHPDVVVRASCIMREISVDLRLPASTEWIPLENLGIPAFAWRHLEHGGHLQRARYLQENWGELIRRLRVYKPGFVPPPI